jgi:serine/threonine protein kinase
MCFYYVMELADPVPSSESRVSSSPNERQLGTRNAELETYLPHTLRHDLEHQGRLPIPDCVQIGLSLSTALAHLHEQGLVHRDIKPSNIIFVKGIPKLADIGLVTSTTEAQSFVGTDRPGV